ncbi:hypothetical protein R1sor_026040 [Riccia sorocarpa]|uniref:Uncharacterized protein n=1 Tax=Riccia sorocarpa TaxID=122646 RepID=A0ABD3GBZ9_9MARC
MQQQFCIVKFPLPGKKAGSGKEAGPIVEPSTSALVLASRHKQHKHMQRLWKNHALELKDHALSEGLLKAEPQIRALEDQIRALEEERLRVDGRINLLQHELVRAE